jgi:uncharacterized protein
MPTEIVHKNRLGAEKSPYLLQHQNNPVHWFPWGDEAFVAAKRENKPIFLSIGYSTCYWCHVMEKDSFEIQEVADVLNKDFISIKVDREEHPDVDQIYMDAVVAMTGRGGWPMSIFMTPKRNPFFGGTYIPRTQFLQLMAQITTQWKADPSKMEEHAERVAEHLQQEIKQAPDLIINRDLFTKALQQMKGSYDKTYGGFGGAPKFPQSVRLSMLLRIYRQSKDTEALKMIEETLHRMAAGGMYDHLGGGFHRYSTDEKWHAPHFEKMLYDNALLAITYLEAYQVTHNKSYAEIARETLEYVLREMTHPEGGFYSAQDAGEVGKEGEYYLWTVEQLDEVLEEGHVILAYDYATSDQGNFEGSNILYLNDEADLSILWDVQVKDFRQSLLKAREKRSPPHKDDKILTSWNGLMIAAMAKGYQVLGEERFLTAAQNAAKFIREHLSQGDSLQRRYRDGEGKYAGTVEDYAFMIYGLLELYQSDFDLAWFRWIMGLQEKQDQVFWDEESGGYFFTEADDAYLIVRKKEINDGALPSANSIAALNLLKLNDLTFNEAFKKKAQDIFELASSTLNRYPSGLGQMMIAVDYYLDKSKEIAIIGRINDQVLLDAKQFIFETFLPNKVLLVASPETVSDKRQPLLLKDKIAHDGKTTIYVCEEGLCKRPVADLEEVKKNVFSNFSKTEE